MDELTKFLAEARKKSGYEVNPPTTKLPDGTHVIGPYTRGTFSYTDKYRTRPDSFEGSSFVQKEGSLLWTVKYEGFVNTLDSELIQRVYDFLKKALRQFPMDRPFERGPTLYSEEDMRYMNICRGDMSSFTNQEKIFLGADEAYFYKDDGGLINKQ